MFQKYLLTFVMMCIVFLTYFLLNDLVQMVKWLNAH
jgi:hypothetical protein